MRQKSRTVKLSKNRATPIALLLFVDVLIGRGFADLREGAARTRLIGLQVLDNLNIRGSRRPINGIDLDHGDADWFGCRRHVSH